MSVLSSLPADALRVIVSEVMKEQLAQEIREIKHFTAADIASLLSTPEQTVRKWLKSYECLFDPGTHPRRCKKLWSLATVRQLIADRKLKAAIP